MNKPAEKTGFIEELKRRNVVRVGVAYLVSAWLLLQLADIVLENISAPQWIMQVFMLALGIGLPIALIFAWAFELTPEGIKREKDVDRSQSITPKTGRKLDFVIIGVMAVVIVLLLVDRFTGSETSTSDPVGSRLAADQHLNREQGSLLQADKPPAKSIAVLPFVNMSEDANNEFFSDGISEEILNALAKVTDLKVAGRTSSFAFKGQNQDLREIGAALNVSHILEGSVRKAGNRVRVTAQLIKVDDGYHIWSENYDRELDDIFAIQDEISASILQELKAHLIGEQTTKVARTDTEAYELYLLAGQRIYERNQASLQMASDLLGDAIGIDPGYAPAYAQLGIATMLLSSDNYGSLPTDEAFSKAKALFDRALELDPQQAEAMAGMGLYEMNAQLDYDKSVDWLERALAINPNLTNASVWLAISLSTQGELKRNVEILQQTFAHDPLHPPTFNNLAQELSMQGRTDEAMENLENLQRFMPSSASLSSTIGRVQVFAGNWAESDQYLTRSVELEPLNSVDRFWLSAVAIGTHQFERVAELGTESFGALALDRLGRTEEALQQTADWVSRGNTPEFALEILARHGRFQEIVDFIESRWPDLDALDKDFPRRDGFGVFLLDYLAQAYSQTGNEQKFNEVMALAQESLDSQLAEGADNWVLHSSRAMHAMLSGDYAMALDMLDKVAELGGIPRLDFVGESSPFAPLRGDERYENIIKSFEQHRDAEREKLGLEPLTS
ncbi:MAG: FlgO family outer membrane protein [Xanthomonadales bacterium]|nr:FlgO family outer membrane protein [Xanthomonadales bacterium]